MDKGRATQLDYIIGSKKPSDQVYVHNDVKLWGTWDHYPIYATIQEDDVNKYPIQRKNKKKWAGWRPLNDDAKIEQKKTVITKKRPCSKRRPGDNTKRHGGGSEESGAHRKVRKRQRSDTNTRDSQNKRGGCSKMYKQSREGYGVVCRWQIH